MIVIAVRKVLTRELLARLRAGDKMAVRIEAVSEGLFVSYLITINNDINPAFNSGAHNLHNANELQNYTEILKQGAMEGDSLQRSTRE